jgi:hypothetical protein
LLLNFHDTQFSNYCLDGPEKQLYLDGPEKLEVENGKDGEGDERHGEEVCNENIVASVGQVGPQACRADSGQQNRLEKILFLPCKLFDQFNWYKSNFQAK